MAKPSRSNEGKGFFFRYADELEGLAAGLARLQVDLAEAQAMRSRQPIPQGQQALDELTQRAQALADVARRMQDLPHLDEQSMRMLVANLKLADVAARLTEAPSPAGKSGAGELELF